MGVIVCIDKVVPEYRALTNLTGNAVAALLIGKWTNEIGLNVARATPAEVNPFAELSLESEAHTAASTNTPEADTVVPDPQATVAEATAKADTAS